MIKMLAAICRRPGMTHAEYLAYVHHVHGAIARANPVTMKRYVQNHVFDSAFGSAAEAAHAMVVARDSVTELYWDSADDMKATFSHEYVRVKVGPDGANFSDTSQALSMVAVEAEQAVTHPGAFGGAKVLHYLRADAGLPLAEFFARWSRAHVHALEAAPAAAAALRRCVHNRQLPEFNAMLAYFGGSGLPIYEGVGSLYFDHAHAIGAFRAYESALLAYNANPATRFYAPDQSFFLYATEAPIYQRPDTAG